MIIAILAFLLITTSVALFISTKKNLEQREQLDELADQIEESLDILDKKYKELARIAAMDVMSNEPIVREFVMHVKDTCDAVLLVANMLVVTMTDEDENE
jgi:hypothetical protein